MLSLEGKIGQMAMVGFQGLEPPDHILEWLANGRIGGVHLFSRNIKSPAQVRELTQSCHDAATGPILIGIDQEGGAVARLRDGFTESPGAMALSAAGSEELAAEVSKMLATEMLALGINWVFAPVADITHDINNPTTGTRSPGMDKEQVSRMVAAEVHGFQTGGVAACAKHYPGLGNSPVDTHEALAVIDSSLDFLRQYDLVPFQAAIAAGVATMMTTHTKYLAIDTEYPATMSPAVIQKLLREELGYNGVVCTDCMEMKAVADNYGPGESAVLAALAGVDLILVSHTREYQEMAYAALVEAAKAGRLSEEFIDAAVARIQAVKACFALTDQPSLNVIHSAEHLTLAARSARAGTVLLRSDTDVFPIKSDSHRVGLIEFASYIDSPAMDKGGKSGLVNILRPRAPKIEVVSLRPGDTNNKTMEHARKLAGEVDVLVLATRSAHLQPAQLEQARDFLQRAKRVILLCLRNPYDVNVLPGAQTIICTCGDSAPSLQSAVEALLGDFIPSGKLPVSVELDM